MSPNATVDRERRWALPTALATLGGVAGVIASLVIASSSLEGDTDAEVLRSFHEHSGTLLASGVLRGIGFALLAVPLVYLFRAVQARSDAVRPGLIGLVIAAPLFLAAAAVITWVSLDDIASEFLARSADAAKPNRFAESLIEDSTLHGIAGGLSLGGSIGLTATVVYCSLYAMRTGLVTRFWGSLGIAVGAVFILLPAGVLIWLFYLGSMIAGWSPGGRPAAWEAGVAIPWPKPGEEPPEQDAGVVEGSAEDVSDASEPEAWEPASRERPQRRQAAKRRKRKRRTG